MIYQPVRRDVGHNTKTTAHSAPRGRTHIYNITRAAGAQSGLECVQNLTASADVQEQLPPQARMLYIGHLALCSHMLHNLVLIRSGFRAFAL